MKSVRVGAVIVLVVGIGWGAAVVKKKAPAKTAKPVARVTAAQRAAAREQVEQKTAARAVFENAETLEPFYKVEADKPVHILQFGDSHTASDDWVNAMRQVVQGTFGDGGPGFIHAGRPFRGYRRFDARATATAAWRTEGTMALRGDPDQGLSGLSISTSTANQSVSVTASGELLSVFYLAQPGGGRVELTADDVNVLGTIATEGSSGLGVSNFTLAPGEHTLVLRTLDHAPVRLYGWSLDHKTGATFETLGINGAQANVILGWNEAIWAAAVAARNPALVLLAYGTNEANSRLWAADAYRSDMIALIARVRRAAPQAAILMIGPPDCGLGKPLVHLSDVVDAQRAIAKEQKVAFFDLRQFMGGARSVNLWFTAGYGQADRIHLTGDGYHLIGDAIAHALLEGKHEQAGLEHTEQNH